MSEWKELKNELPEVDEFVLVSVRGPKHIFLELLEFDRKNSLWKYRNGSSLEIDYSVIAWKGAGPVYTG